MTKRKRIAILGATGQIAKNLILGMCEKEQFQLFLIARSFIRLEEFASQYNILNKVSIIRLEEFEKTKFDVIINCIGIGDPGKLKDNINSIFTITETFDNLILNYLLDSPDSLYINFSSGAAYLTDYSYPVNSLTPTELRINNLTQAEFYGISKINSEAKHRSYYYLNIVDLRIFGFFSRHIDLNAKFFLTDVIKSLDSNETLMTDEDNIIRDYVHPFDLIDLIELVVEQCNINDVFDVYSLKPTTKIDILEYFSSVFGLQYFCSDKNNSSSFTGKKTNYYSENFRAKSLGYQPKYDSLTTIIKEYQFMKSNNNEE